jgi:hypothetical protein
MYPLRMQCTYYIGTKIGGVGKCIRSLVGIAMCMKSWMAKLSRQLISLQRKSSN